MLLILSLFVLIVPNLHQPKVDYVNKYIFFLQETPTTKLLMKEMNPSLVSEPQLESIPTEIGGGSAAKSWISTLPWISTTTSQWSPATREN